jgi:hypothetical protein
MADLAHALSLAALVAATLEYAILVRHREGRRDAFRFAVEAREALMWAHRFDKPVPKRRWVDGRFRLVR